MIFVWLYLLIGWAWFAWLSWRCYCAEPRLPASAAGWALALFLLVLMLSLWPLCALVWLADGTTDGDDKA